MNVEEKDALVAAMLKARLSKIEAQNEVLSKYSTIEELLIYLADASPKERESFLKLWKTDKAKSGVGRKKRGDSLEIYSMFVKLKKHHNIKTDGKMYDRIINDTAAKMQNQKEKSDYVKKRRDQRAGFLNKITAARKQLTRLEKIVS
jgi:hypothetical protein